MINLGHDFDSSDESSSIDTHDAFLEMFGLSDYPTAVSEIDKKNEDQAWLSRESKSLRQSVCSVIQFPHNCSRHGYQSQDCFGLILDNIMNENECRLLMELSEANGFRYIEEATHYAPDGSSYTVRLQNPNSHKMSAIDTYHRVDSETCIVNSHFTDASEETLDNAGGFYPTISPTIGPNHTATTLLDCLYQSIYNNIISSKPFHKFMEREKCGQPLGLNPRIRVLKYDAIDNDSFRPHFDATTFVHQGKKKSLVTVLLYLNSGHGVDFQGGNTLFTNYTADMFGVTSKYQGRSKISHDSSMSVSPMLGRVVLFEHDMFHSGEPLLWGTKYILRTDILFRDGVEMKDREGNEERLNEKSLDYPNSVNDSSSSQPLLISDICTALNLSHIQCLVLKDLGLYECTCEAFLSPGMAALSVILTEHGMDRETMHNLIQQVALSKRC